MYKKMNNYFSKHVMYTSVIHAVAGIGIGLLVARPFVSKPVFFGILLLGVSIAGHIFAGMTSSGKKK
jgi:NO-binding membrane sensor protein with MHYT domain